MKLTIEKDTTKNFLGMILTDKMLYLASETNKKNEKSRKFRYWTFEDDEKLSKIAKEMSYQWNSIALEFPGRSSADVEQRWRQRIDPSTKKTTWSKEEDQILCLMHKKFGGKWKLISSYLPGRLPSSIKNRFYGKIFKQQARQPLPAVERESSLIGSDDEMFIENFLDLSDNESISSGSTSSTCGYHFNSISEKI